MHLGATAGRRMATLVPPALVAFFTLPFILKQNAWFEWANPYWLLQRQTEHVAATGLPTLFLHLDSAAFNPFYVYYAGPLLSALAYPAVAFGTWPVFVAVTVGAIVAGYLGIWWTARTLGLSRAMAALPALAFTSAPYVLTNLYGRGAWAEFVATNAGAVLLGGTIAMLFQPAHRRAFGPAAAVVGSMAVIAGSHNLTLLMSAIVLPVVVLLLLPLRPSDARPLLPALLRLTAACLLGLGLVSAWLIPNLWYGRDTLIAQPGMNNIYFLQTHGIERLANVLSPFPHVPPEYARYGNRTVYAQVPVLALLWAVAAIGTAVWRRRRADTNAVSASGLALLGVALMALITHPRWWLDFPAVFHTVQFPYRLLTYVAITIALGVMIGLRTLQRPRGSAVAVLGLAVTAQLAFGIYVVVHSRAGGLLGDSWPTAGDVHAYSEPAAFSGQGTGTQAGSVTQMQFAVYGSQTARIVGPGQIDIGVGDQLTSDSAALIGVAPPGAQVDTPVVWSPFVRISGGATLVGRDQEGLAVAKVDAVGPDGRWTAEVVPATPWPLGVGRAISALSVVLLVGLASATGAAWVLRMMRRRRAVAPAATDDPVPPALLK